MSDPFCEKIPVYQAGEGGYHVVRIPTLLVAPGGTILAGAEARHGRGQDWDDNEIFLRRSEDGGKTWQEPVRIASNATYGGGPLSNFAMIADAATGDVHALFCYRYSRVYALRSADDGKTWSPPREISAVLEEYRRRYPWVVIATGPGHGLQLRNGRLIVPLWMSDGTGYDRTALRPGHRPSDVGLIYSDDHGDTWRCGDFAARTTDRFRYPSETAAVELPDGSVLFNMRNEGKEHRRLVTVSADGASGWSEPAFDEALLEPVCLASMVRLSWPAQGRSRVLFANPATTERLTRPPNHPACDRKNLTVRLSYDECKSWPVGKTLEAGPSGYSDLQVTQDGTILCLYEGGGALNGSAVQHQGLLLARFNLEWLTEGRDSLAR